MPKDTGYNDYIRGGRWRHRRDTLLPERYCKVCKKGGAKGELHGHHLTYWNLYDEKHGDLVWLCQQHHRQFHKNARERGWWGRRGMEVLIYEYKRDLKLKKEQEAWDALPD